MYIYNPENLIPQRIDKAKQILENINIKYAFITGSFLYKKKYNDIDVLLITRNKNDFKKNELQISKIDFNKLHSLKYHSMIRSCVSKSILPRKDLKVTLSDYWQVVMEAIVNYLNDENSKDLRDLILYTEYYKKGKILDSYELHNAIKGFNKNKLLIYVFQNAPDIFRKRMKKSYLSKFFYSLSGFYEDSRDYEAYDFLYNLCHYVINGKSPVIQKKDTKDFITRLLN